LQNDRIKVLLTVWDINKNLNKDVLLSGLKIVNADHPVFNLFYWIRELNENNIKNEV
jgi:hypothetical protein